MKKPLSLIFLSFSRSPLTHQTVRIAVARLKSKGAGHRFAK